MDSKKFLGSGMKFPIQINKTTGRFAVSSKETSVKESIYLILMTQQGERILRPSFGSEIMSYTFKDANLTFLSVARRELKDLIMANEPRISDVLVNVDSTSRPGYLIFDIEYTVAETNTRDNFVFPYYLNQNEDEEEGIAYEPVEEV